MAGFGAARACHGLGFTHTAHPYFQSAQVKRLARADFGRICCADSVWGGEGGADPADRGSEVIPGDLLRPLVHQAEMKVREIRGNPPYGCELLGISRLKLSADVLQRGRIEGSDEFEFAGP